MMEVDMGGPSTNTSHSNNNNNNNNNNMNHNNASDTFSTGATSDGAAAAAGTLSASSISAPILGERHVLQPMEELRVEIPFANMVGDAAARFTLQKGSCELWGCELALGKTYSIANGGIQLALFTWHGCIIDVDGTVVEIAYISDETHANVAFVNTHAQLEALRDDAMSAISAAAAAASSNNPHNHNNTETNATNTTTDTNTATDPSTKNIQGPRVMIVGPPESGKTSLCKTLLAYACKVGRTPLWVDLDPNDNSISIPGTLAVAPMTSAAITVETYATCGIPPNAPGTHALVVWHGTSSSSSSSSSSITNDSSNNPSSSSNNNNNNSINSNTSTSKKGSGNALHVELFQAQVDRLAININARLAKDENARSSGIIVNTNGWIQNDGYKLLLHTANALDISVILIMGHDRLYSVLTNHYKKLQQQQQQQQQDANMIIPKIIKLPRSGGVVSRPDPFLRQAKSRAIKRYFYGDMVDAPNTSGTDATSGGNTGTANNNSAAAASSTIISTSTITAKVPQLTPFLMQVPFHEVEIYKLSSMALSRSLLPVAQQQTTDAIQIVKVHLESNMKRNESSSSSSSSGGGSGGGVPPESLTHAVLAVCHPFAVQAYQESGRARDLVTAGVAGFCTVERVLTDTDTLHLLSPCAGTLPSKTLLLGDITWME